MTEVNVSIIIPTYNVAPYIRKCLESVASQTYTGSMECLIVDDCGPDNSIQIAEEFIKEYNSLTPNPSPLTFRIIHREKNGGLSAARNSGIREAKGEYLYFLDSDDYINPDCIQSMWQMVERFPGVECVFAGANVIGSEYEWMDYTKKQLPDYSNDRNWLQESMLKRFVFSMTAWNRLISADFVRNNNLYFEEGFIHEDELWNLAISQAITNAAFVKANTYNYIVRGNSIMTSNSGNDSISIQRRIRMYKRMLEKLGGHRKGLQATYIAEQSCIQLGDVTNFREYVQFMLIIIRATFKADKNKRGNLLRLIFSMNRTLIKDIF